MGSFSYFVVGLLAKVLYFTEVKGVNIFFVDKILFVLHFSDCNIP